MASKPKPRNISQELGSLSSFARDYAREMAAAQAAANQTMINQALDATDKISGKLNNDNTKQALGQIAGATAQVPELNSLADRMDALATRSEGELDGTEIESELKRQALSDLRLGRSLSAEQEREAQQGSRVGFASRGMAIGMPATLAEVLGRDVYATGREQARRGFAGSVNQMVEGNNLQRMGQTANLLGQTAGTRQNTASLGLGIGQAFIAADPYQRALGSNIPVASQGPSAQMVSNAFGQILNYGSDLYNTNFNASWSNYLNNQNLGLAGAGGRSGMGAAIGSGIGTAAGTAIGAMFGGVGAPVGAALGGAAGGAIGGMF
jgi:hypothetical protein